VGAAAGAANAAGAGRGWELQQSRKSSDCGKRFSGSSGSSSNSSIDVAVAAAAAAGVASALAMAVAAATQHLMLLHTSPHKLAGSRSDRECTK